MRHARHLAFLVFGLAGCGGGSVAEVPQQASSASCYVRILEPFAFQGTVSCSNLSTFDGGFDNNASIMGKVAEIMSSRPFDSDAVVGMPSSGTQVSFQGCTDWNGSVAWGDSAGSPRTWALNVDLSCRSKTLQFVASFSDWQQ
jgi:hypothetical protein